MKYIKESSVYTLTEEYIEELQQEFPNYKSYSFEIFDNLLVMFEGYSFDGATCSIDTESNLRASAVHDCLCTVAEASESDFKSLREKADKEYYRICKEDGMANLRAMWSYLGIRAYGTIKGVFK